MATIRTTLKRKFAGELLAETEVDANAASVTEKVYTAGAEAVVLQVAGVSGGHTTHVVTLEGSLDGETWVATNVTVTGAGAATLSSPVYPYHRAKVTTPQGAASVVNIYLFAKSY